MLDSDLWDLLPYFVCFNLHLAVANVRHTVFVSHVSLAHSQAPKRTQSYSLFVQLCAMLQQTVDHRVIRPYTSRLLLVFTFGLAALVLRLSLYHTDN